jgi:hypothetical protein
MDKLIKIKIKNKINKIYSLALKVMGLNSKQKKNQFKMNSKLNHNNNSKIIITTIKIFLISMILIFLFLQIIIKISPILIKNLK